MHAKYVILAIISTFVTAAVYSSSVPDVSAKIYCSDKKGTNYEICTNTDTRLLKYVRIQNSLHPEAEPNLVVRI